LKDVCKSRPIRRGWIGENVNYKYFSMFLYKSHRLTAVIAWRVGGGPEYVRRMPLLEHLRPGLKALDLVGSVALEAAQNLFNGFFFCLLAVVSVLGKEIVGVTD